MNNGRFQILLRRRQNKAQIPPGTGPVVNVIVQCNPVTGYAEYVAGDVDNTIPFADVIPENGWYDFSGVSRFGKEYIEPESVIKTSFTWDKVNAGNSTNSITNPDGSNYDKGISSELWFRDTAWAFISDWLTSDQCQILNCIEVKIIDLIARGTYRLFEIKTDNLDYAPVDEPCQFHIKLREQDNIWHCVHKTFIWDNHQHWFENSTIKEHPCFLTCIEPRPRLIQSARMGLAVFFHSNPLVNLVDFITGHDFKKDARKIFNADRFVDAPLVRTYIENAAAKCGLEMDTIFDEGQEWDKVCIYYPQAGYMHESDDDAVSSPSLAYHFDNRWLITIAELLDKLKIVYAAEWYVTPNNTIIFKYTKDLQNLDPIYDYTLPGAEPIYGLRYTFNGDKKAAYGRYEYQPDGSDLASQEISTLYNDIIDYDGPAFNPMLEGDKTKNFEFAPTGFVRDGRSKDYMTLLIDDGKHVALILLGILVVVNFALAGGVTSLPASAILVTQLALWVAAIISKSHNLQEDFVDDDTYTGAVRLTSEQVLTPRLILWDGARKDRAKAVATTVLPLANTVYNPTSVPYNTKNKINQDNPDLRVYNYPLYFDGDFLGNMFDKYHDVIDNPLHSLETNQDAKWYVDDCEDMLHLFGVFENEYAVIGKVVKLEERDNYDVFVRIGNINVDHDAEQINLRGTVIRRARIPEDVKQCSTFMINSRCLIINGTYININ